MEKRPMHIFRRWVRVQLSKGIWYELTNQFGYPLLNPEGAPLHGPEDGNTQIQGLPFAEFVESHGSSRRLRPGRRRAPANPLVVRRIFREQGQSVAHDLLG